MIKEAPSLVVTVFYYYFGGYIVMDNKGQRTITVQAHPFDWHDKIGYMFGDIGNNFSFNVVNSFLMIFYTNVYGLTGSQTAIVFLLARFVDAITDVVVGRLVDNSKLHKRGRFIPWMQRMQYPLLIALVLLFVPMVRNWPMAAKMVWVWITYIAWGVLYSTVNIPYGSLASAISSNPDDKTSLSTWRSVGSALGSSITSYIIPMFIYIGATKRISGMRFWQVVIACAILGWVCYEMTIHLTTERIQTEKSEKVALSKIMKSMLENRALLGLILTDLVLVVNQNLAGTMITYVYNDWFENSTVMALAMVVNTATVILLSPFSHYIATKWGRRNSSIVGLIVSIILYGILFAIRTTNPYVYLGFIFFGSLGFAVFNLQVWAFITDVIDDIEVNSGDREDGIVYGVNSFARKVAQAIGGGFGGFMLSFIGYKSSTTGGAQQSMHTINGLYNIATLVPVVCAILAVLLLAFVYPLTRSRVQHNAEVLEKRRAQAKAAMNDDANSADSEAADK